TWRGARRSTRRDTEPYEGPVHVGLVIPECHLRSLPRAQDHSTEMIAELCRHDVRPANIDEAKQVLALLRTDETWNVFGVGCHMRAIEDKPGRRTMLFKFAGVQVSGIAGCEHSPRN